MPLDPAIEAVLAMLAARGAGNSLATTTPVEARRMMRSLMVDIRDPSTLPAVREVLEIEVAGAAGALPARLYLPPRNSPGPDAEERPVPTLVFLHGGGWVIGDLDTHEATCRMFCREVGVAVLSVAYRLAPEHPFPAGVEDAVAATRWAAEHRAELGGPGAALAIGGDSAGGNLAAVTCQVLRGTDAAPAAQLLIYPAVDFVEERPSVTEYAEGHLLTRDEARRIAANIAKGCRSQFRE